MAQIKSVGDGMKTSGKVGGLVYATRHENGCCPSDSTMPYFFLSLFLANPFFFVSLQNQAIAIKWALGKIKF